MAEDRPSRKCSQCGSSRTRMMVQMTASFPSSMDRNITRANMRKAVFRVMGVQWETADVICEECGHVSDGYGNYVSRLVEENEKLKAQLASKEAR